MKCKNLIVMEGACDGNGKTTQYNLLRKRLQEEGETIITHHFPSYGTPQGQPVEEYLSGKYGTPRELSPYFINSLYAIDRGITWNMDLKEEYDKGSIILLDRYTTSNLIYQSALLESEQEKKDFIDYVCAFEYDKLKIQKPDTVVFLEAPFEVISRMRSQRTSNEGLENDIHERDLEYMKKVYENALFVAKYLDWDMIHCAEDDRILPIEAIHEKVYQLVKNKNREGV